MTRGSQYKEKRQNTAEQSFRSYFSPQQRGSPSTLPTGMATPRDYNTRKSRTQNTNTTDPMTDTSDHRGSSPGASELPILEGSAPPVPTQNLTGALISSLPPDLQKLLQCIPTKDEFEMLAAKIDAKYEGQITSLQQTTTSLANTVQEHSIQQDSLVQKMSGMEARQNRMEEKMRFMQLQMEDLEDRNRRNNVRIKGFPEHVPPYMLHDAILTVFKQLLGDMPPEKLELDRIHRAPGQRFSDSSRPRDVLCRVHFFNTKDSIVNKAWKKKNVEFEGTKIQILPDLSRNTLRRRAIMKPMLQKIVQADATYKWGYPLHLIVKKNNCSYPIFSPSDVPSVLHELGIPPFQPEDWLRELEDSPMPSFPRPRSPRHRDLPREPRSPLTAAGSSRFNS